jgi:hypothetical protein
MVPLRRASAWRSTLATMEGWKNALGGASRLVTLMRVRHTRSSRVAARSTWPTHQPTILPVHVLHPLDTRVGEIGSGGEAPGGVQDLRRPPVETLLPSAPHEAGEFQGEVFRRKGFRFQKSPVGARRRGVYLVIAGDDSKLVTSGRCPFPRHVGC